MNRTKTLGWLVGAAALLFAGCTSDDNVAEEPQQPTAQTQAAVIHVTVGAGISDGEATTRSTVDYTGGTRTLQFTTGDRLYVWGQKERNSYLSGAEYYSYLVVGTLELVAIDSEDPTKATFRGDLSVYSAEVEGLYNDEDGWIDISNVTYPDGYLVGDLTSFLQSDDPLGECEVMMATLLHKDAKQGEDYFISDDDRRLSYRPDCAATVDELMTTELWVRGNYNSSTKSFALTKTTDQPIVNCTISGLEAGANYRVDYIYGTTAAMSDHTRMLESSMTATGGTLAFAFIAEMGDKFHGIRLTNIADAGDTYTISLGQKEFEGKVYNVSRRFVDLSDASIYSDDGYGTVGFIAQNGDILSGTMPTDQFRVIVIADGAKVTLHNATIESSNYGIGCNGSATINLEGTNTVSSSYMTGIDCSGTLTILGSGSLTATGGNGYAGIGGGAYSHVVIKGGTIVARGSTGSNDSGAGIGGYGGRSFGTIRIEGGDVTATGGDNAAGIGGGYRQGSSFTCGTITITGGNVRATGGANAAGIGCGKGNDNSHQNVCGDITISGGTVTAEAGTGDCSAIGYANYYCRCNNVTIEGGEVTANSANKATIGAYTVSITSGITSVTMTNSAATSNYVSSFINGNTISIDNVSIGSSESFKTRGTYGNVLSVFNTSTCDTWTLTKK